MVGWVEAAVESNSEELFNKLPTMRTSNLQSDPETSKPKIYFEVKFTHFSE